MELLLQLLFNGIASGALYAVVALGFGLIYNTTRIFHIAHGINFTVAGYLLLTTATHAGFPLWLAATVSVCGSAVLGVLMELAVYRPLYNKNAPAAVTFVSSLGIYIFLQNLIAMIYGSQPQPIITSVESAFNIASVSVSRVQILQIAAFVAVFVLFYVATRRTKFGKSLKAVSDNPVLAEVVGIDIKKLRTGIFALGSVLAGLGGVILASDVGVDPYAGMPVVLLAVVSVIIGGVGILEGALAGGILIGVLQAMVVGNFDAKWQNTTVFLVLIIFLLLKPEGLLGSKRRLAEVKV
ncbi:MAG TPA: branched-chain amino acid ABC transporter permease [Pyrinomonadaceae bacterium]|nr:branched-chain amino acid ABC transporter permease [Pyrinomonadaceae bacterium]